MKVYFENFGNGADKSYLTPLKHYEVIQGGTEESSPDFVQINDDVGDSIWVTLGGKSSHTNSLWKISPEEIKAKSASDIVADLEAERNALANSVDNANKILDNLSVPKAETLGERIKLLSSKSYDSAGVSISIAGYPLIPHNGLEVETTTEKCRACFFVDGIEILNTKAVK